MVDRRGDLTTRELLKKVRKETGMTQIQFSTHFHIPRRTYEDWERGISKMPEYVLRLILYKVQMEHLAESVTEDMVNELD